MVAYNYIPICNVTFSGYLDKYEDLEIGAYHVLDLIRGICCNYKDFEKDLFQLGNEGKYFVIIVNDSLKIGNVADTNKLLPNIINKVEIKCVDSLQGKNTLPFLLGAVLIGAAFAGVGILGISSTTIGLLGTSLVASSIFKVPKIDKVTKDKDIEKRSVNFSGTINTTGGGQPLPLVFGEAWIGSIVASAHIAPEQRSIR